MIPIAVHVWIQLSTTIKFASGFWLWFNLPAVTWLMAAVGQLPLSPKSVLAARSSLPPNHTSGLLWPALSTQKSCRTMSLRNSTDPRYGHLSPLHFARIQESVPYQREQLWWFHEELKWWNHCWYCEAASRHVLTISHIIVAVGSNYTWTQQLQTHYQCFLNEIFFLFAISLNYKSCC